MITAKKAQPKVPKISKTVQNQTNWQQLEHSFLVAEVLACTRNVLILCNLQSTTMRFVLLIAIVLVFWTSSVDADVKGEIYYLAFMDITSTLSTPRASFQEIFISSVLDTNVKLIIPMLNLTEYIWLNISNKRSYQKLVTTELAVKMNSPMASPAVAIQITSDQHITVQANKAVLVRLLSQTLALILFNL